MYVCTVCTQKSHYQTLHVLKTTCVVGAILWLIECIHVTSQVRHLFKACAAFIRDM